MNDGAWTWFNDERAIWNGSRLHIGYVRNDGRVAATCYNSTTDVAVEVPLSSWRVRDDHNNPSFYLRSDGCLVVAYTTHGTKSTWWYRVSHPPYFPQDWGPEQKVDLTGAKLRKGWTYCNLYSVPGHLINFGRGIDWNPTFCMSTDYGATWGPAVHLIKSDDRPYFKCSTTCSGSRIDLAYTDGHPSTTNNSIYHMYFENGSWHRTDGSILADSNELPIECNRGTVVYPFARDYPGPAWIWDIQSGKDGNPVIVFTVSATTRKDDFRYCYATWDASEGIWVTQEIAKAGGSLYRKEQDYVGGIAIDKNEPAVIYCSTAIDPVSGSFTPHRELYMGMIEPGRTCSWRALTADSPEDNLRPFVPSGRKTRSVLWMQGKYRSYKNYDTKILLLHEDSQSLQI